SKEAILSSTLEIFAVGLALSLSCSVHVVSRGLAIAKRGRRSGRAVGVQFSRPSIRTMPPEEREIIRRSCPHSGSNAESGDQKRTRPSLTGLHCLGGQRT